MILVDFFETLATVRSREGKIDCRNRRMAEVGVDILRLWGVLQTLQNALKLIH